MPFACIPRGDSSVRSICLPSQPLRCSNAEEGHFYTASGLSLTPIHEAHHAPIIHCYTGVPSNSSSSPGNCATSACSETALVAGAYFTRGWANSSKGCEALVQHCDRPSPGWRHVARGSCDLGRCDSIPAGSYFIGGSVSCTFANCTNLPKSGFEYTPGLAVEADGCPYVSCRVSSGSPAVGRYYSDGCHTSQCTTAPTGYYYLADGGDSDSCPNARCSNAQEGEFYVEGANACDTSKCNASLKPGYRFASPGWSCEVTRCPLPPLGKYHTGVACDTVRCVNGDANPNTYYVHGYADDEMSCPQRNCTDPPPPGLYVLQEAEGGKNCVAKECTNTDTSNQYYTSGALVKNGCSVAKCNRPPPGTTLIGRFATSADTCQAEACHATDLPTGYFWKPFCASETCDLPPAGYYYLRAEIFSYDECKSLLGKCTNAKRGQVYVEPTSLISNASECPVKTCNPPEDGQYHGFEAQCGTLPCTGAAIGQRYTSSRETKDQCPVATCPSIDPGKYYISPGTCDVSKCHRPPGYEFTQTGTCSHLNRCQSAPLGTYYTQSSTPCSFERCTGTNNFLPGFSTRDDECPKCREPRPGHCYSSESSCETTELCPTTTKPSVTQQSTSRPAKVASDDAGAISGPLIGGIAGGAALLLIVVIGIIVCVMLRSKSNAKLVSAPAKSAEDSSKVTTIAAVPEEPAFEIPLSQRLHLMLLSADDFMLVRDAVSADSVSDLSAVVARVGLCGAERLYCDAFPSGLSGGAQAEKSDGFASLLEHANEMGSSQCEDFLKTCQPSVSEIKRIEVRVDMPGSLGPGATTQIVDQYRIFDVVLPGISPGSVVVCSVVDEAEVT